MFPGPKIELNSLRNILGLLQKTDFLEPLDCLLNWLHRLTIVRGKFTSDWEPVNWGFTAQLRSFAFPLEEHSLSVWEAGAHGCSSRVPVLFWVQLEASCHGKKVSPTPPWKPQLENLNPDKQMHGQDDRLSGPSDKPMRHVWDRLRKSGGKQNEWVCELIPMVNLEETLWFIQAQIWMECCTISRNMRQWFVTGRGKTGVDFYDGNRDSCPCPTLLYQNDS